MVESGAAASFSPNARSAFAPLLSQAIVLRTVQADGASAVPALTRMPAFPLPVIVQLSITVLPVPVTRP